MERKKLHHMPFSKRNVKIKKLQLFMIKIVEKRININTMITSVHKYLKKISIKESFWIFLNFSSSGAGSRFASLVLICRTGYPVTRLSGFGPEPSKTQGSRSATLVLICSNIPPSEIEFKVPCTVGGWTGYPNLSGFGPDPDPQAYKC